MRVADLIVLAVAFGGPLLVFAGAVLLVLRIVADINDDVDRHTARRAALTVAARPYDFENECGPAITRRAAMTTKRGLHGHAGN